MDMARGIGKGTLIGGVLGLIMLLGGVLSAGFICGAEDSCSAARSLADVIGWDSRPFQVTGTALEFMAALLGLGLAVTMMPRQPVRWLGAVFMALMAGDGFLMALEPAPTPVVEAEKPTPLPEEIPDELLAEETQRPACRSGTFRPETSSAIDCLPCTVEQQSTKPAALSLIPMRTEAHWVYASDQRVETSTGSMTTAALVQGLADEQGLCDAPAILVFGSASSDGPADRNRRRARSRADRLASAVAEVCGSGVATYALSLGQSQHDEDDEADRPVSLTQVYPLGDAPVSGELVLQELGYALAEQEEAFPLLARRNRFPQPWTAGDDDPAQLDAVARPQVTEVVRDPQAPASCTLGGAEGLDEMALLRQ